MIFQIMSEVFFSYSERFDRIYDKYEIQYEKQK